MRSPELVFLLQSLTNVMNGKDPAPSQNATLDSERLIALLEEHQLTPLLARHWCRNPAGRPTLRYEQQHELELAYFQSGRQAVLRQTVVENALHLLQKKLDPVFLKGFAILPLLYREAAERPMRDVDLLLKSAADQQRARDVLLKAGFTASLPEPEHHHLAPLHDPSGRIGFELHHNLATPPLPDSFLATLLNRRIHDSRGLYTLDPVGLFLHHALHAIMDPIDSPFLRDLFEVGALAARLTPEQQREADELARAGGIHTVVSRSLRLAHNCFGTPLFLDAPPPGPYESWCERRLEWTAPPNRAGRLMRHLARERFNRLCEHPDERNPLPWLLTCGAGLGRRALSPLAHLMNLPHRRYVRAPHAFMPIGPNTLIHDASTGEVHMLNDITTQVWQAADVPQTRAELMRRLAGRLSVTDARAALTALRKAALLLES